MIWKAYKNIWNFYEGSNSELCGYDTLNPAIRYE
jgi:hypothetical protein